eukprot:4123711-Prymnesium_polylepis.1
MCIRDRPGAGVARAHNDQPRRRCARRTGRARVLRLPAPRRHLQPTVGPREREDHGAGRVVGDVR